MGYRRVAQFFDINSAPAGGPLGGHFQTPTPPLAIFGLKMGLRPPNRLQMAFFGVIFDPQNRPNFGKKRAWSSFLTCPKNGHFLAIFDFSGHSKKWNFSPDRLKSKFYNDET